MEETVLKMTVPLFIRLLEFAREESCTDVDLHFVAENVERLSNEYEYLDMDTYKLIMLGK